MADIVDRAILVGIGVEKKLKELLGELEGLGKDESTAEGEEGLPPRKAAENRIVDEGAKLIKEFISVLTDTKDKLEHEVVDSSGNVLEKLNVAVAHVKKKKHLRDKEFLTELRNSFQEADFKFLADHGVERVEA